MQVFNAAISRMVVGVLWTSPVGIASLIAASMLRACDLGSTLAALGLWLATIFAGLLIQAGALMPAMLWAVTKQGPLPVLRGFSQALVMGFGTSSSTAALPVRTHMRTDSAQQDACRQDAFLSCKHGAEGQR